LLTIAAPTGPGTIRNLDLSDCCQRRLQLDGLRLWYLIFNFNAPLFRSADDPSDASLNVDAAVQTYLGSGVPAEKLVLGVPFYGKGWAGVSDNDDGLYQLAQGTAPGTYEPGSYDFKDIQKRYLPDWQAYWSEDAHVPWLYDPSSQVFISYDDERSLEAKAGYARIRTCCDDLEISQGDANYRWNYRGLQMRSEEPNSAEDRSLLHVIHQVNGYDGKLEDRPIYLIC
jgi:chitinase